MTEAGAEEEKKALLAKSGTTETAVNLSEGEAGAEEEQRHCSSTRPTFLRSILFNVLDLG